MTEVKDPGRGRLSPWSVALRGLAGLWGGLTMVLRHLGRRPVTEQYPEYKRFLPERARARIILTRDPDGEERCVACFLCSGVCPTSCISMECGERQDGRRYAPWFRINFARCIYCGLCEEACPTLAIQLTPFYEFCEPDILAMVAEKKDLLVAHGGKNLEYNFYRFAGVAMVGGKGSHIQEAPPVDLKSNLP
jgi:NADH-quinone oxidoreductase subunit I